MNSIIEVMDMEKNPSGLMNIRKVSKNEYVDLRTGEVITAKITENRGENIAGLKNTFKNIRDLINANFRGLKSELFITLTYAENMTDTKKLYIDFEKFWKRFKYKYGKEHDYITVVEPQGRGAWHHHLLIKNNKGDDLYIPSHELEKLWGHGFIKIRSLEKVDNIGAYVSAYLSDVELTGENLNQFLDKKNVRLKEVQVDGKSKAFIKGGRVHLYPSGMNLYRKSKGIKPPLIEKMPYREIKREVGNAAPNYSKTVKIYKDNEEVNTITYEQYNLKRIKNKD